MPAMKALRKAIWIGRVRIPSVSLLSPQVGACWLVDRAAGQLAGLVWSDPAQGCCSAVIDWPSARRAAGDMDEVNTGRGMLALSYDADGCDLVAGIFQRLAHRDLFRSLAWA
jgi:hypothetical protein